MSKRAVILASLSKKAPILLYVKRTLTTAAVLTATYRKHVCASCKLEVAFGSPVDGMEPMCPSCGSSDVPPTGEIVQMDPQEELLLSVGCPRCATQNVIEDRTSDALQGNMHCAACGCGVPFAATADVDDPLDEDTDIGTEAIQDEGTDDDEDESVLAKVGTRQKGKPKARPRKTTAADVGDDAESIARGVAKGADAVADALADKAGNEDAMGSPDLMPDADDMLDVDLSDVAPEDGDTEINFDEDTTGESARLLAFVNGVHVATLTKKDAGENQDLFETAGFHAALNREAKQRGHRALAAYGFKGCVVRVPVKNLVNTRVQAALAEAQVEVTASVDNLDARWAQSATIAATALTKGFYKNRPNPLSDVLIAQLESMGFNQARQVVGRAMLQAGPLFVKATLDLTRELLDKSDEGRNELSDTLSEMSATVDPMVDSEEVGEKTDVDSIVARLNTGVTPSRRNRSNKDQSVTASVPQRGDMASQLRALKNLK